MRIDVKKKNLLSARHKTIQVKTGTQRKEKNDIFYMFELLSCFQIPLNFLDMYRVMPWQTGAQYTLVSDPVKPPVKIIFGVDQ